MSHCLYRRTTYALACFATFLGPIASAAPAENLKAPKPTVTTNNQSTVFFKVIGGPGAESVTAIKQDKQGNIYIAGTYSRTVNFAADFGKQDAKTARGMTDAYITRINADGSYSWTKTFGGKGEDTLADMDVSPQGAVYAIGGFYGSVDFGADFRRSDIRLATPDQFGSVGRDLFVLNIASNGSFGWVRRIGGRGQNDLDNAVLLSQEGLLYASGSFNDPINFSADFSGEKPDLREPQSGAAFLMRLSPNGAYGWTKVFEGKGFTYETTLTQAPDKQLVMAGLFHGADFGVPFGKSNIKESIGLTDIFILDIGPKGTYTGTHTFGGPAHEFNAQVAHGSAGTRFVTGLCLHNVDFRLSFGGHDEQRCGERHSGFLAQYTTSGAYQGTKIFPGQNYYFEPQLTTDSTGSVYLAGRFEGKADIASAFGGKVGAYHATGFTDAFIVALTPDLNFRQGLAFGGPGLDAITAIAPSSKPGKIYIAGTYTKPLTTAWAKEITAKPHQGNSDIFIGALELQ